MKKQHFEAAAAKIKALVEEAARRRASGDTNAILFENQAQGAAEVFASVAIDFNPRFDRARFYAACGLS